MFLKLKVFAAILVLAYSLQLEAQHYSGSYKSNYIGNESKKQIMSEINYNLPVYNICDNGQLFGIFICRTHQNVYVLAEYCITQFNSSNVVVGGLCPYFPTKISWCTVMSPLSNYYSFPARLSLTELTNFTCGKYNREGRLCGRCKPGYGPAVYAFSLMCAKCSSNSTAGWALYLFLVLFPITVFYIFVIIFNIRATAPPFTAFVLMCQTYCMMELLYLPLKMKVVNYRSLLALLQIVRVLCGFWNLDFFRYLIPPFCVSSHLSNIQALTLEYIHVMYPLVLILITYLCVELHARNFILLTVIWKPFHKCVTRVRRSWDPRASIVNAFSTFLLLNFSKVVIVAAYCFYGVDLRIVNLMSQPQLEHASFLYSDPFIRPYSKQHLPYLLCSASFLVVFFLTPTLLLCLYPTKVFRKLLQCCLPLRWQQSMSTFMDTFQGHYKDGTNGTRDCRGSSGIHLVVLCLMVSTHLNPHDKYLAIDSVQLLLVVMSLFYALARPCKKNCANILQSLLLALTAFVMLLLSSIRFHVRNIFSILLFALLWLLIPHALLGSYVIIKVTKRLGLKLPSYRLNLSCNHMSAPMERDEDNCPLRGQLCPNEHSPLIVK